jgi:hypothetical protein
MRLGCAVGERESPDVLAEDLPKFYQPSPPLEFEIDLIGWGSRIKMNGQELPNVRDIKVHQPLDGGPIVTVEFQATTVKGWKDG